MNSRYSRSTSHHPVNSSSSPAMNAYIAISSLQPENILTNTSLEAYFKIKKEGILASPEQTNLIIDILKNSDDPLNSADRLIYIAQEKPLTQTFLQSFLLEEKSKRNKYSTSHETKLLYENVYAIHSNKNYFFKSTNEDEKENCINYLEQRKLIQKRLEAIEHLATIDSTEPSRNRKKSL